MDGILQRLHAPGIRVRSAALHALGSCSQNPEARRALAAELERQPNTTGTIAARILGERGIVEGIPQLRLALSGGDPVVAEACMVALASLGDRESLPRIEAMLRESADPRFVLQGIEAVKRLGAAASLQVLLEKLHFPDDVVVVDEILIALASMAGFGDWFYPRYRAFLEGKGLGVAELEDWIDECTAQGSRSDTARRERPPGTASDSAQSRGQSRERFLEIARSPLAEMNRFPQILGPVLSETTINIGGVDSAPVFLTALEDPGLLSLDRFRFFCAAALIAARYPP